MSRPLSELTPEELLEGYLCLVPDRYRVTPALLRAKTVDCDYFWPEMSEEDAGAWVAVKRGGPWTEPGTAHVAAVGGSGGEAVAMLLRDKLKELANEGISKVTFGAGPDHLFPGCPTDADILEKALGAAGFSFAGEAHDVEADLAQYQRPALAAEGLKVRRASAFDASALDGFLAKTFPGRWRHDVMKRFGSCPADVVVLEHGGEIAGMAMTQSFLSPGVPQAGGVWHLDLGEKWGAVGPIGVAEVHRGQGWGHALLAWALEDLRAQGVQRAIIDWTSLLGFYGQHGFEKTRTYRYATASVSPR